MSPTSLSGLIDAVYDAPLSQEGWSGLAPMLERQLGGRVAIFMQSATHVSTLSACSRSNSEMVRDYEERLWPEDRAMRRLRRAAPGEIVIDSDLVSARDRQVSPLYGGYLAGQGLEEGLYASVWRQDDEDFIVSAQRCANTPAYGGDHAELLRILAPHFARSLRIWRGLQRERQERRAVFQAAEHRRVGVMLVDGGGRLRFANAVARRSLRAGALTLVDERLCVAGAEGRLLLARALAECMADPSGPGRSIVVPDGPAGQGLAIQVTPAPPTAGAVGPLALLVFDGAAEPPAVDPVLARARFGLTDAEARLLAALVAGERLNRYANGAGISVTTARTHLRALFDKTGERRQADLVRRALISGIAQHAAND